MQRTLGIIGGIAPPSTIDYYREITSRYRARSPEGRYPSLLIDSLDGTRFLPLVGDASARGELVAFLLAELERLARAGADLAIFASNTPHVVFDEVAASSPMPLISIVEEAATAAAAQGHRTLGLLGAEITMSGGFYQQVFERRGMRVVTPTPQDRAYVNERYFAELTEGVFLDDTRSGICAVVDRMVENDHVEAVVLGGTELPLLFRGTGLPRLPTLDTTSIHVDSVVTQMLSA
jgi:aspartate racemase